MQRAAAALAAALALISCGPRTTGQASASVQAPQRYTKDAVAIVSFESGARIAVTCGPGIVACFKLGVIHLPNPCDPPGWPSDPLLCHELSHANGWPADHPNS
jgi:hypothetical protein